MERLYGKNGLSTKHPLGPLPTLVPFLANVTVHSRSNCTTILRDRVLVGYLPSNCLWNRGCSLWKLLSSTSGKTEHLFQSHANYFSHLHYIHAHKQHLEANRIDFYTYEWSYLKTHQPLLVSFILISYHPDHVGSRWVHGGGSNYSPGPKIYNVITDMALCHVVSGRLQRPQDGNNCLSFAHFIVFFW